MKHIENLENMAVRYRVWFLEFPNLTPKGWQKKARKTNFESVRGR